MTAVVIGAGIGGLGAALRLRAAGMEVLVLEARPLLGGKMHQVVQDGYVFDAGPSFLTQPHRLDELFALFGEQRADHLAIERVDPSVTYHWSDGTTVTTPTDRQALVEQLSKLGSTPGQIQAYLDDIAHQYERVSAPFVDSDVMRAGFWLSPRTLLRFTGALGQLGRTFHAYNQSWFPDAPRLVQVLDRYATYAGSDPYQTPSFMSSIADVELRQGIFYPEGGLRSVPEALIALGERHGVQYRTQAAVTGLIREQGRIEGVLVGEERIDADVVISAIDPQHLAPMLDRERSDAPRALSALVWFVGTDAKPQLGLHNIFFSDDYQGEFERLGRGETGLDPTIYINCSAVKSPEHAPAGMHNWFVMINAPADDGQDWEQVFATARPRVMQKLERILGPFPIHTETTYCPLDIARTSGAYKGAIYGPASNGMKSLFAKQSARDPELANLFYCGGSSHPGGGIPMCLSSARIATDYAISASS